MCLSYVLLLEMDICENLIEDGCFEQSIPDPVTAVTEEAGWGWDALFGGAVGWMLGRPGCASFSPQIMNQTEGVFTPEEKDFISQLWRFERELRDVQENEEWERLYLLVLLAGESLSQVWKEFVPGNPGYSPSSKFDGEIREILNPFLLLCKEALALDFESLISPAEFAAIGSKDLIQVNLNYATMIISIDGVPFVSKTKTQQPDQ